MKDSERIIARLYEEERERLHDAWTWGEDGHTLTLKNIPIHAAANVAKRIVFLKAERVSEIAKEYL
jgi:hypothetical protein